jgi:toxin HigB-1
VDRGGQLSGVVATNSSAQHSCIACRYGLHLVIISFRHKGLETFYYTGSARGIQAAHSAKLTLILTALDAAETPRQLRLPAFKLHPLKGQLNGYWSIWVNGNWRVTFRFSNQNVELVDYRDYH